MNIDNMFNHSKIIYSIATILMVGLIFSITVHAETVTQDTPAIFTLMPQLLSKSIFRENEQSTTSVRPRFDDNSTNIAFYAECPTVACPDNGTLGSPEFIFFAENTGHGDLPFSDYWAPDPSFHKLVAVEYFNDAQQFTCSDLSLNECIANPHFISQFSFEVVDNNAIIPVPAPPTIDIIDSGATPVASLPDTTPVDSTSTPTSTPEPVIQENSDGSTTLISI